MKSILFHFNGKVFGKHYNQDDLLILERLADQNKNLPLIARPDQDEIDVFTFDNKMSGGMLTESCKTLNIPLINLGDPHIFSEVKKEYPVTDKWKRLSDKTTAKVGLEDGFVFMHRYFALYHYIKHNKTKRYVSLFDQPDTFIAGNLNSKLDLFREKGCGMLFQAESKCMYWPMAIRTDEIYPEVNRYLINYTDVKNYEMEIYGEDCFKSNGRSLCFLNGGGMIADRDYFVNFFEKYLNTFREFIRFNDQTLWHHFHFCYYPNIQIDHKCEIFQCMGPNKVEFNL